MIRCPKCDSPWRNPVALAAHIANRHDVSKETAEEMAHEAEMTSDSHRCNWCKRPGNELHTPGCRNPKAEGRRGAYKAQGGGPLAALKAAPPEPVMADAVAARRIIRQHLEEERTDLLAQVAVVDRLLAKVAGG